MLQRQRDRVVELGGGGAAGYTAVCISWGAMVPLTLAADCAMASGQCSAMVPAMALVVGLSVCLGGLVLSALTGESRTALASASLTYVGGTMALCLDGTARSPAGPLWLTPALLALAVGSVVVGRVTGLCRFSGEQQRQPFVVATVVIAGAVGLVGSVLVAQTLAELIPSGRSWGPTLDVPGILLYSLCVALVAKRRTCVSR